MMLFHIIYLFFLIFFYQNSFFDNIFFCFSFAAVSFPAFILVGWTMVNETGGGRCAFGATVAFCVASDLAFSFTFV